MNANFERLLGEQARFWQKVSVSKWEASEKYCWNWHGSRHVKGYGRFRPGGSKSLISAHRYSWELVHGKIEGGLHVCHKCDNPSCVRPSHLFLGTNAENMADRAAKGRGFNPSGEAHPNAKLSQDDVINIRRSYIKGVTKQRDIAEQYGVSQHTIWTVLQNRTWVQP